jgi:hypothetical protein
MGRKLTAWGGRFASSNPGAGEAPRSVGTYPFRLAAVAEAAARGEEAVVACSVVGRVLAREGVDLGEALDELRTTTGQAAGRDPSFAEIRALGSAWAEETTSYVHQLSCEDPLNGLASAAHLRARLAEVYRGAVVTGVDPAQAFGIAVVEVPTKADDPFELALWMVRVVDVIRMTFPGEEAVVQLGATRVGILVARDGSIGVRLAGMRLDLEELTGAGGVTVWIEGLPSGVDAAAAVLDELLRR